MKDKLITALRNLGEYNKALAAVVGGVLMVANQLGGFVEGDAAVAVLAILTAASVWLVKNQDKVDRAGDTAADLLD